MNDDHPSVAYFCMEYGLHADFPIYSGGLGVLAGDHMKSAGDLRLPVTGIGLFWSEGYTVQTVSPEGTPVDAYPPTPREALAPVCDPASGAPVEVEVDIGDKRIPLRAFRVTRYTDATLYLLEPRRERDRWITRRLYGGGAEDRIAQEIVLGVGGVRLLRALGLDPDVFHFNEGHAVFAGLELVREHIAGGAALEEAVERVRPRIVFTTHTPVAAGNEVHELAMLRALGASEGFTDEQLEALGGDPFSMTVAGLRLAHRANGVAELHSETARSMWRHVDGGAPIIAITNGVHAPTWQDARVRAATVADKPPAQRDRELWAAHQARKHALCELIEARTGVGFDLERPLVGFARRAATYKRADLVFADPERLEALFEGHGLQLVFAGKAHPRDVDGKAMVERLVVASRRWPQNVVFLEGYDMHLGAALTRGCDMWLNNPRRPMEASGTSGMKAAMNGVLNVSILDGWWPEGCRHGVTGWRIGDGTNGVADVTGLDEDEADELLEEIDAHDRDALYDALEREVLPAYANRERWVTMMRASIEMSQWRFSSDRMALAYFDELYPSSC